MDHALCLLGFWVVPVREVDPGHHLIEATINGRTGQFVLDTGANLTVVTTSQAERFGLSSSDSGGLLAGRVLPAGASGNARQVAIDGFAIGPITVRQKRILIADLDPLLAALGRASGQEIAGIVGQDVLTEHRAIIDVAWPMLYLMETMTASQARSPLKSAARPRLEGPTEALTLFGQLSRRSA